jgi:hypothetical protein
MNYAERIREMHADGLPNKEIASAVDRGGNYVRAVLSKARKMRGPEGNGLIKPRGRPKKGCLNESAGER